MRISVLGAGAWGTALASHAAQSHDVVLWGRDASLVAQMAATHINATYLPGIALQPSLNLRLICKPRSTMRRATMLWPSLPRRLRGWRT